MILAPQTEPTQQPKQNCLTWNQLINNPAFKEAFEIAWKDTAKSGKENGGWIFYDPKANTLYSHRASEGERRSMPRIEDDYRNQLSQFQRNGQAVVFFAMFHTHPGGTPYPSGDDLTWLGDKSKSQTGNLPISKLGIVIHGPGKYTLFHQYGELSPTDRRLNDCIQW